MHPENVKITLIALGAILLSANCDSISAGSAGVSDRNTTPGADTDSDSDTDTDADTDMDSDTDADGDSDADPVCHVANFNTESEPVRMMILLDRSTSMNQGGELSKWEQASYAINITLDKFATTLEFGFDVFPKVNYCGLSANVRLDTAQNQGDRISSALANIMANGATPLLNAMKRFNKDEFPEYAPVFTDGKYPSYLLVVSDGADTCGASGRFNPLNPDAGGASAEELAAITSTLLNNDIKTFVIGFGEGANPEQLNAIAANGGTAEEKFIQAMDQDELEKALATVGGHIVTCNYNIEPEDDTKVNLEDANFYFDGEIVKRDDNCANGEGWTFTDDTRKMVNFCKQACNQLKNGDVKEVSAEFGCPSVRVY